MSIGLTEEAETFDQNALIKVCGVGGGGGNAVTRMIQENLRDVDFIAINTDAQALKKSPAGTRLQIGADLTGGLGSGAKPDTGKQAALDDRERIFDVVSGADMIFVTTGLGGGTGTGAAPVVAEIARSTGALTVGIATLPFSFEGAERMQNALKGLVELEEQVDTMIVIPNDRVERLCQENISLLNAFHQADEVLHNGVRAISELITIPGLINLDFADVRTIMQSRGRALMGIGVAEGEGRAIRAAEEAIICPLLEQSNINGAKGVIVNIKGGSDIGMREVQEAVSTVQAAAHPDANIIFGAVIDDDERAELQVTVIAAGFSPGLSQVYLESSERIAGADLSKHRVPELDDSEPVAAAESEVAESDEGDALLFPTDEPEVPQPAKRPEADEDLSIPAFMRKRKKSL